MDDLECFKQKINKLIKDLGECPTPNKLLECAQFIQKCYEEGQQVKTIAEMEVFIDKLILIRSLHITLSHITLSAVTNDLEKKLAELKEDDIQNDKPLHIEI